MKLIFMGTPALAVPCLDVLRDEHEIILAVTQPDKPAGRGHQLMASPVKQRALECGIAVSQPERARNDDFVEELRALAPDAIAVVAYGQILPRAILELAPRGCVNLHFSLLPRWRGAAPVQRAILNGDTTTGVTTQWMAEKLDAGDVISQREVEIAPDETSGELLERLTPIGAAVLRETMQLLDKGEAPRTPQDESGVTIGPTIKKEEGHIDWNDDASSIVNRVRAMNPWPTAWCDFHDQPLKIWRAMAEEIRNSGAPGKVLALTSEGISVATGSGAVLMTETQAPGKPRMKAADWARGARLEVGQQLG